MAEEWPCEPWPIKPSCCRGWPEDPEEWTSDHVLAVQIASEAMWRLTAGRYGLCRETVRPCRKQCRTGIPLAPVDVAWMTPVMRGGSITNVPGGCGCDDGPCGCGPICEVAMPGPVHQVEEILVDGQPLPPDAWMVQEKRYLIRTDGACWPECQQLDRPDSDPGTWSVRYLRGRPIPPGGVRAVSVLACEYYKQCAQNGKGCKLPQRVTSVEREGLTYTLTDPMEFLDRGRVGLAEVDQWLSQVNPHGHWSPMSVWSPDLPQHRTTGAGW
ncbi:hypothetical protein [Streptomyces sp. TR02-1]|uniref:hypothetical protein n=1 Tax=Streptomyces sp. TR02-1 TaxID=3385977 RepID=UPI0039A2A26D